MKDFEKYLQSLAEHEEEKSKAYLDPRKRILMNAGFRLNWMGDFLANPKIKFKKRQVPINKILFTGTTPRWNKILIDKCDRNVEKFQQLIEKDKKIKNIFTKEASFGNEAVLMRGPDEKGCYRLIDGMHRLIGAIIKNKSTINAYVVMNEKENLPICEAHVVYDLIRGFQRHANDRQGKTELLHALKLLSRTYGNVTNLLKNRFNFTYIPDKEVQKIISKVLK